MQGSFLEKLKSFDRNDIPTNIIKSIKKMKGEIPEFSIDAIKKNSESAVSLAKWALAILNYAEVAKEIEPKKKKADEMVAVLKIA